MKKVMMTMAVLAAMTTLAKDNAASAVSPDGRNTIVLNTDPLSYEVLRDGTAVVGKSRLGIKTDGKCLVCDAEIKGQKSADVDFSLATPVYKKGAVALKGRSTLVDFGDWTLELLATDQGVAFRYATKFGGEIAVDDEKTELVIPDAKARCWFNRTDRIGNEETVPEFADAGSFPRDDKKVVYLPFVYAVGGKTVAVSETDLHDYPILNFKAEEGGKFISTFKPYPKATSHASGWGKENLLEKGGRWVRVLEEQPYLVKTAGTRTFPWRVFMLADAPSKLCENDMVYALGTPAAGDFSWVRPGKVAWDWWNSFDNQGEKGCNTKTYERFIDFAAKNGVEYVIFDEGWSESLNIWKFHPDVDVPHLIKYAEKKGVGIILWMAWAQVVGDEERVAEHFAKLGAKGFKVDFMDRGDAAIAEFLEKFAAACAKNRMLIDYHGTYRPVGLNREYPNVINYEAIHGLENMKWAPADKDMPLNDVACFFLRLTAGPMDYTPGAMLNYAYGKYTAGAGNNFPGSVGTRCHQMAMMAAYEGYLQMLSDSPTNYEKNMESFEFMAKVPTVWTKTVGLGGCPESYAAVARQAKDGSWYVAGLNGRKDRAFEIDTAKFLGAGEWTAEIFRDTPDGDVAPQKFLHEKVSVKSGDKRVIPMVPGGGFIVKFTK